MPPVSLPANAAPTITDDQFIPASADIDKDQMQIPWFDKATTALTNESEPYLVDTNVFGNRLDGYRNSKRMAINGMVKRLCKEEDVGYVDLWDSFVGKEEMYVRDGLHLSGKGAAVFAEGLSGAVASGLGKVRYLN